MPTAVVRVVVDVDGSLSAEEFGRGLARLCATGLEIISAPVDRLAKRRREVELIVDDLTRGSGTAAYVEACSTAFGLPAQAGVVTYISRGTDEDATGVLDRFGVIGAVDRHERTRGGDLVVVTIDRAESRRVPESRLHTALEAALNSEVQIRFA
jgi:hypothetical protein